MQVVRGMSSKETETKKSQAFKVFADDDVQSNISDDEDDGGGSGYSRNHFQRIEEWNHPYAKKWISFTEHFFELAYGTYAPYFDGTVIGMIILAGVNVGIQTYPEFRCPAFYSSAESDLVEECRRWGFGGGATIASYVFGDGGYIDLIVTAIFCIEVVVKVLANGMAPWNYWVGADKYWNNFDFFIVLFSFKPVAEAVLGGGGGTIRVLRLFRLARLWKLIARISRLEAIVNGLVMGLMSVGYISVLLFLVFYIFAVGAVVFFGDNDPLHFRTLPVALLSLFRAATLEDWTDMMYISYFGCDKFSSGLYYSPENYVNTSTGMDLPNAFNSDHFYHSWHEVPNKFKCTAPVPQPVVSVCFWVAFVLCSAFVMLSLFVGAVTGAMQRSLLLAEEREEKEFQIKKMKMHREKIQQAQQKLLEAENNKKKNDKLQKENDLRIEKLKKKVAPDLVMKAMVLEACKLTGQNEEVLNALTDNSQNLSFQDPNIYKYAAISRACVMFRDTVESLPFQSFVTACIVIAGMTEGINAEYSHADLDPHEHGGGHHYGSFLWFSDTVINWVFTTEITLKLLGLGLKKFFKVNWNVFDFTIVALLWVPYISESISEMGWIKVVRLLRLFRVARFLKIPQLAVIVDSLIEAANSVMFIGVIMIIVFYMFAILGMVLFQANDNFHFGYLHRSMLSLFRVVTFDDWTDIMYINMYGCREWGYSDDDSIPKARSCKEDEYYLKENNMNWVAALYFIVFVTIGALILITLFISVVQVSIEDSTSKLNSKKASFEKMVSHAAKDGIGRPACEGFMAAFDRIDEDDSGSLSVDELMDALMAVGFHISRQEMKDIVAEMDTDDDEGKRDGEVDPFEFYKFINKLTHKVGENAGCLMPKPPKLLNEEFDHSDDHSEISNDQENDVILSSSSKNATSSSSSPSSVPVRRNSTKKKLIVPLPTTLEELDVTDSFDEVEDDKKKSNENIRSSLKSEVGIGEGIGGGSRVVRNRESDEDALMDRGRSSSMDRPPPPESSSSSMNVPDSSSTIKHKKRPKPKKVSHQQTLNKSGDKSVEKDNEDHNELSPNKQYSNRLHHNKFEMRSRGGDGKGVLSAATSMDCVVANPHNTDELMHAIELKASTYSENDQQTRGTSLDVVTNNLSPAGSKHNSYSENSVSNSGSGGTLSHHPESDESERIENDIDSHHHRHAHHRHDNDDDDSMSSSDESLEDDKVSLPQRALINHRNSIRQEQSARNGFNEQTMNGRTKALYLESDNSTIATSNTNDDENKIRLTSSALNELKGVSGSSLTTSPEKSSDDVCVEVESPGYTIGNNGGGVGSIGFGNMVLGSGVSSYHGSQEGGSTSSSPCHDTFKEGKDYLSLVKQVMRMKRAELLVQGIACNMVNEEGLLTPIKISLSKNWKELNIEFKTSTMAITSNTFTYPLENAIALHRGQISKRFYIYNQRKRFSLSNFFNHDINKKNTKNSLSLFYVKSDHDLYNNNIDVINSNETLKRVNHDGNEEEEEGRGQHQGGEGLEIKKTKLPDYNEDTILVDEEEDDGLSIDIICENSKDFFIIYGALKRALIQANKTIEEEEAKHFANQTAELSSSLSSSLPSSSSSKQNTTLIPGVKTRPNNKHIPARLSPTSSFAEDPRFFSDPVEMV